MCIAIYSPVGNDVPCKDYLYNSFLYNPDGAGFAYNTVHNNVQIEKGFMDWNSFWNAFQKANAENDFKKRGVLIHFRITTHGGTNPQCCHPFPLVSDESLMKKTNVRSDYAVIHNGIIDLTSTEACRRDHMSDTMVYIEKYLSKIASNKKWFRNKTNFELIYDMIGSKMAILNGHGEIHSTYGFTKDSDGNYYSNTSYKEARMKKTFAYKDSYGWNYNDVYGSESTYYDGYGSYTYRSASKEKENEKENENMCVLMRLDRGEVCCTDNLDEYEYEDDFAVYITENSEVYAGSSPNESGFVNWMAFIGFGEFLDKKTFTTVDFRADAFTTYDILYDYEYDYTAKETTGEEN